MNQIALRLKAIVCLLGFLLLVQGRLLCAAQIDEVWTDNRFFEPNQSEAIIALPRELDSRASFFVVNYEVGSMKMPTVKNGKKISGGEGAGRVAFEWLDNQTLRLFRERTDEVTNLQVSAELQMVTFKDGVKVQSGVSILDANTIEKEIVLEPVQLDAAFPLIGVVSEDWFTDQSESFTFTATLTDDRTLKLVRNNAPEGDREADAAETKVMWQVIEFQNSVTVRSGTTSIQYYSTTVDVDLSEAPISNPSKTFLVFNFAAGRGTQGSEGLIQTRGTIMNNKLVQFNRTQKGKKANQGVDIVWYLVELNDEASLVQKGSEHFAAAEYLKRIALQEVDPNRSVIFLSSSGGLSLSEGQSAKDLMHNNLFRSKILNPTELELSRKDDPNIEEIESNVDWFVVEFAPLTMGSPKGGEVYRVGRPAEITWQHAASLERGGTLFDGSHAIDLFLSFDEGEDGFVEKITSKFPAKNDNYSWIVPEQIGKKNLIGNKLRIKIVDSSLKVRNSDVSRRNFAVKGDLKLSSPNGGDVWRVGENDREVVWNYQGKLGTVSIYYDTESGLHLDSFSKENAVATNIGVGVGGIGSFTVPSVPDLTCKTVRVKVVQDSDPTVYDVSQHDFAILPRISILSPGIDRDVWTAQTEHAIKWKTKGAVESFDLFYSIDQGKKWNPIISNYAKGFDAEYSYLWQIPVESVGNVVLIKVQKTGMKDVFGISSAIEEEALRVAPWIQLMKPKPDQILSAGRPTSVVWRLFGEVEYLQVESSLDGGKTWAKEGVVKADADDYEWKVPNVVTDQLRIRLIDTGNYGHQAVSAMLKTQGTIEVLYPNGGELMKTGDTPEIKWKKSEGMAGVDIRYSTDGGLNYPDSNLLSQNTEGNSWKWNKLPYIFNETLKVRVASYDDSSIADQSDQTFSIQAT